MFLLNKINFIIIIIIYIYFFSSQLIECHIDRLCYDIFVWFAEMVKTSKVGINLHFKRPWGVQSTEICVDGLLLC